MYDNKNNNTIIHFDDKKQQQKQQQEEQNESKESQELNQFSTIKANNVANIEKNNNNNNNISYNNNKNNSNTKNNAQTTQEKNENEYQKLMKNLHTEANNEFIATLAINAAINAIQTTKNNRFDDKNEVTFLKNCEATTIEKFASFLNVYEYNEIKKYWILLIFL